MKTYKIFVEGVADQRFMAQFMKHLFGDTATESCIIKTDGCSNLMAKDKEDVYVNEMKRTTDDGGVNLVIFDADNDCARRREEIMEWKKRKGVNLELFLFPDNVSQGAFEDLLERIINPENKEVMDCWNQYEDAIGGIKLDWKHGEPLTIPAKKTKIYAYLEVLLGKSKSEKEKIKEKNRDYTNANHWDLNASSLDSLVDFLKKNLQ